MAVIVIPGAVMTTVTMWLVIIGWCAASILVAYLFIEVLDRWERRQQAARRLRQFGPDRPVNPWERRP